MFYLCVCVCVCVCVCACVLQEALRYYNQTTMQLQMLEFSRQRLVSDDEVRASHLQYCCAGASQDASGLEVVFGQVKETLGTAQPLGEICMIPMKSVKVWVRLFAALSGSVLV